MCGGCGGGWMTTGRCAAAGAVWCSVVVDWLVGGSEAHFRRQGIRAAGTGCGVLSFAAHLFGGCRGVSACCLLSGAGSGPESSAQASRTAEP